MAAVCASTMDRAVHRPNPGSARAVRICGLGWAGFAIGAAALRTGERGTTAQGIYRWHDRVTNTCQY